MENLFVSLINGIISIGEAGFTLCAIVGIIMVIFYNNDNFDIKTKFTQYCIFYGAIVVVGIFLAAFVKSHPDYEAILAILYIYGAVAAQICTIAYPIRHRDRWYY